MLEHSGDAYLVGEHFHDYLPDLDGSTWPGVMNYSGFTRPMWTWLVEEDSPLGNWMGMPRQWPRLPGGSVVETMRRFAPMPWTARTASMNIVSSHDSPRIRTIAGDNGHVEVAVGAMFTLPGVPMIWSGDEIGLTGVTGEDGRKPFPWNRPEAWNRSTFTQYSEFMTIRRDSDALRRGGLRWAFVDEDRMVFLRESASETCLVMLARASGGSIRLSARLLGFRDETEAETLYGGATLRARSGWVDLPGDGPSVHVWRMTTR
jgi:alpha-glucosidase